MRRQTTATPKARPGDRVAVLSPALAAPAVSAAVHEQAMRRLGEVTGLIPVEYPTTRLLNASAEARAADVTAAFADPTIRAVLATVGGDDQITVVPHIDTDVLAANPKPFLGYSDNTHLHNLLWGLGVPSFYGGSTQVHLGAGPGVDEVHRVSLRAALLDGGEIELTDPGESEDHGLLWTDPRALHEDGDREPTGPWAWAGPARSVSGRTWGGCIEVIYQIALAGRMPAVSDLEGAVLLIETSEETPPAAQVRRWVRSLGEGGILGAVAGVLVARPPVTSFEKLVPEKRERDALRAAQRDVVVTEVARYNPDAVVCVGVPFGHTRPQWIVPHGGVVRLDGVTRTVTADYS
ncbi:muramoyltetrapeptide carboxypeptidase LdcA involved in peptidoglycan recycling [Labedella gwakjiensis]|uniref:LD-carboxypeptidase n=1 Tax=Labedella gwakjiensis TaxID=390269 RepID=A0A2P8GZC3_9MICO|nr:S66 peptidase family protein [Labedella gwakjiensis]PSL39316.1 muramoyltetrapeptide carboxypeptidase LdcA involved in peptidoglycan recycling [Labedella gwakjiensis]RUQ86264.1 LD-carboxypeptidase [Labedella gwakjiensis]